MPPNPQPLLKPLAAMAVLSLASLSAHAQVEITDPPAGYSFGKTPLLDKSTIQYFFVVNRSTFPVQLGPVTSNGSEVATCAGLGCPVVSASDFVIVAGSDGCSNAVLQPGQSCSTLVGFSPTEPGARLSQLIVPLSDGSVGARRVLQGTGVAPLTDCVLDWAEKTFPQLLTAPTGTFTVTPYHLRCYANGAICLGADTASAALNIKGIYAYQPQATPPLQRLGDLSGFAQAAQCR